ncbi:zinc finger CCCH domain-containing protein 14 isoform X2 [Phyllopteryx taeniolatus]|uniref:zinc finger CCCH domain-containing protein 14 isoform X2 n=1 Tax=Phyllopteryx taeniolatus TaxID=161469 RepID=UPI002AD566E5|nr:zinc finger CCCH domain-containing protein 14 isoform X2 [Phyllopteryx taeniolatus]
MEIGTEISKKIRAAIKGKLQELGAYIDEELPDYIMVMVANKKTSQQMADDLSLFLGNNTVKFTAWLHGVLEKLRTVAVEPSSVRHEPQSIGSVPATRTDEFKSNPRSDRTESRRSSHDSRRPGADLGSSRLTSAVKPLVELLPSEAVIDIKPETDDDFGEDPAEAAVAPRAARGAAGRPSVELYRPGQSKLSNASRSAEGSLHGRHQDGGSGRTSKGGSVKEELSRKRKAPAVSSVVQVNRDSDEESDDMDDDSEEEDEDASYAGRGLSSRVSLPSKPERKPTLPPAKQANRNLILKAISEAQDSINKTTAFPIAPQRRTVPVAPRARSARADQMTAAVQLVRRHLRGEAGGGPGYTPEERPAGSALAPARSAASNAPSDLTQRDNGDKSDDSGGGTKQFDTRSFIVSRPQPDGKRRDEPALPRTVQASKEKELSSSPKFIVTLEGVPSPPGNPAESDVELDDVRPPSKPAKSKVGVLQRLQGALSLGVGATEAEMLDVDSAPLKKQKVMERCKFWPVCKSGDECAYHHPTRTCKTFPTCKFGDKCRFIHPNCKYDGRCSKPDCPYTHVSRRGAVAPPARPVAPPAQTASTCRFFPQCKKMDCPFYHPKPCHFAGQCNRDGCTFFHPSASVPPRHALKWTKTQSS